MQESTPDSVELMLREALKKRFWMGLRLDQADYRSVIVDAYAALDLIMSSVLEQETHGADTPLSWADVIRPAHPDLSNFDRWNNAAHAEQAIEITDLLLLVYLKRLAPHMLPKFQGMIRMHRLARAHLIPGTISGAYPFEDG
jgi:hypothetical protein